MYRYECLETLQEMMGTNNSITRWTEEQTAVTVSQLVWEYGGKEERMQGIDSDIHCDPESMLKKGHGFQYYSCIIC